jgi:hypothetical protein
MAVPLQRSPLGGAPNGRESGLPLAAVDDEDQLTGSASESKLGSPGRCPDEIERAAYQIVRMGTFTADIAALKGEPAMEEEQARVLTKLRDSSNTAAVRKGR